MQSNYLLARRTLLLHEDGVRSALVGSLTQDFHPITVAGQRWNFTILPPPDQFYWSSRRSVKQIQKKLGDKKSPLSGQQVTLLCLGTIRFVFVQPT